MSSYSSLLQDGWSALICAARQGHIAIVRHLLDCGAEINHCTHAKDSALMWAVYKHDLPLVLLLADNIYCDINMQNEVCICMRVLLHACACIWLHVSFIAWCVFSICQCRYVHVPSHAQYLLLVTIVTILICIQVYDFISSLP